jgi:ATP-dependent helicase HrpA
VDIRYRDIDDDDAEEPHFIDATVTAAEDALIETDQGDILIFMPTERDIRETRDLLDGRLSGSKIEVLALYGRSPPPSSSAFFPLAQSAASSSLPTSRRPPSPSRASAW